MLAGEMRRADDGSEDFFGLASDWYFSSSSIKARFEY